MKDVRSISARKVALKAHGCQNCDRSWRAYERASHTYAVAIYMRDTTFQQIGRVMLAVVEDARLEWAAAREALIEHAFHHVSEQEAA